MEIPYLLTVLLSILLNELPWLEIWNHKPKSSFCLIFRYVGVCCGIKVLSCIVFVLDWYLIQKKETKDKKQTALTVGEVVNSIISVDKRKSLESTIGSSILSRILILMHLRFHKMVFNLCSLLSVLGS